MCSITMLGVVALLVRHGSNHVSRALWSYGSDCIGRGGSFRQQCDCYDLFRVHLLGYLHCVHDRSRDYLHLFCLGLYFPI